MKLIILKNNILEGLYAIERSVGDNPNLPVLKNVMIKTESGKIFFSATNLELAVTSTVPGKVIENGETTIPFFITYNIMKNIAAERVTLELRGHNFIISTENYEATLQSHPSKEFPIIPGIKEKKSFFEIEIDTLKEAIQNVIVATQFSEIRPEISGIFFNLSSREGLIMVATDSFRLAKKIIEPGLFTTELNEARAIVPIKTAGEVLRVFKEEEGKIRVFIESNQIVFETASTRLTSHIINGRFPEYEAVIPKNVLIETTIEREEFLNAIKLTSSFSGRINDITLKTADNKKVIELSSSSSNIGENLYKVPARIKGDKFSAVFNWRYLLDGLRIYGKSAEIILGMQSPDRPSLITSPSEPSLLYVVMPLKA